MISTAVTSMLKEADSKGSLIPVSSLNDNSDNLSLLSVVVKTRPRSGCFWQKPKYQSRGFSLKDVLEPGLLEDPALTPSFKNTDFVDYKGIFGDKMNAEGKVEGLADIFGFHMGVDRSCEQDTSFGRLKKEEVEVKRIVQDSKDKLLDMNHPWIQQAFAKPRAVLCILTERIMTTDACQFKLNVKNSGNIGANQCTPSQQITPMKASAIQKVRKEKEKKVDLMIPEHSVIAFGVIELKVQRNGKFDLCLLSNKGGFEKVKSTELENDAAIGGDYDANTPLNLNNELEKLSEHFQLLSVILPEMRFSLLQLLRDTMKDPEEVSALEGVLDHMCDVETPDLGDLGQSGGETVQATVDLVDLLDQNDGGDQDFRSSLLCAIHLIVSAMGEMTDEGLSALESCCSPPVLQALQILVQCVAAGTEETRSLTDEGLTVLTEEEEYGKAECLFDLFDVILKRDKDTLRTEMKDQPGQLPLVLSIAVQGLASLVTTV